MTFDITEDIRPVSELKRKTKEILAQVHRTGRPLVITVNGRPDVVLIDAEVFQAKLKAFNLQRLLAEAEEDVKAGRLQEAGPTLPPSFL